METAGKTQSKKIWQALIVIGAVGVIAVIVAPIFQKPRLGVQTSTCTSNLKQLCLGAIIYSGDYDDILPKESVWMDDIFPYIKYEGLFHDSGSVPDGNYGYAYRTKASGRDLSKIDKQEHLILIFDSSLLGKNESSELWSLPFPARHGTGDNVAFADGHAKNLIAIDQVLADDRKVVIKK